MLKKRLIRFPILMFLGPLLGLFLLLNSCGEKQKEAGREVLRIVSLVPSLTQELYDLEMSPHLVGCTSFCTQAIIDSVEVVSSSTKPGIERILALSPSLVLTSDLIDNGELSVLTAAGIRVEQFPTPRTFREVCSEFVRLADILECRPKAEAIVRLCEQRVEKVQQKAVILRSHKPRSLMQIGTDPLWVVIDGMYMCDYINYMSCTNIAANLSGGAISPEFVLAENPESIFVVSMGNVAQEEVKRWYSYPSLPAVQKNAIYQLDATKACQPTPLNFVETLEEMSRQMGDSLGTDIHS